MNKIKQFMSKIADNTNGGQAGGEASTATFVESEEQHSAEGFLCPLCKTAFSSPEILTEHYQEQHESVAIEVDEDASSQESSLQFIPEFQARREIIELQSALADEKVRSNEMQKEMIKIQNELRSRKNSEASVRSQQDDNYEDPKILRELMSAELDKLKKRLSTEVDQVGQLKLEKEILTRNVTVYSTQVEQMKDTIANLQLQLNLKNSTDDATVLRQELVRVQKLMDEMTLEQEKKLQELNLQLSGLQSTVDKKKVQTAEEIAILKSEFKTQLHELETRSGRLDESVIASAALEGQIKSLEEELKFKKRELSDAEKKVEITELDCKELRDEVRRLREQHTELCSKIESGEDGSKAAMDGLQKETESLKRSLDSAHVQLKELSLNSHNLQSELEKSQKENKSLLETTSKEKVLADNLALQLNQQITDQKKEIQKLNTKFEQHLSETRETENKLDAELAKNLDTGKKLETAMKNLDIANAEVECIQASVSVQLQTASAKLSESLAGNEGLTQELIKRDMELKNLTKLFNDIKNREKDLKEEVASEHAAKSELETMFGTLEKNMKNMEERLNECLTKSVEAKAEFEVEKARLEKRVGTVEREKEDQVEDLLRRLDNVGSEKAEYESRVGHLLSETDKILAEKIDLKTKYESSEEGKSLLLERCLLVEANAEKLEDVINDLRRKLDDSQSALKELGRENQSLQVESAKLQGRKWADDSRVNNCSTCSKEFSLTIRKHHCRGCGNIFCNDCSAKAALVPSSKKPVRVCDACYDDLASK